MHAGDVGQHVVAAAEGGAAEVADEGGGRSAGGGGRGVPTSLVVPQPPAVGVARVTDRTPVRLGLGVGAPVAGDGRQVGRSDGHAGRAASVPRSLVRDDVGYPDAVHVPGSVPVT